MHTPDWVQDAIFYQIFPDRFAQSNRVPKTGLNLEPCDSAPTIHGFKGGDLLGVAEHLDYLQELGVTAIYFNPIFASAANHRYHTMITTTLTPSWAATKPCASCWIQLTRAASALCWTASSTTPAAASGSSSTRSKTAPFHLM